MIVNPGTVIESTNFGEIEDFKFVNTLPGEGFRTFVYNEANDALGIRSSEGIALYEDLNEFLEAAMTEFGGEFTNNRWGTSVEEFAVVDQTSDAEINYALRGADKNIVKFDNHFGNYDGITLAQFDTEDLARDFVSFLNVLDAADFI